MNLIKTNKMDAVDKKNNLFYKITIAVLSVVIGVLVWQLIVTKSEIKTIIVEKTVTTEKNEELQSELDSLISDHERIKREYGSLTEKLSMKDSVILANAAEIRKLIASQADYRQIKKKLEYLRGITQGYINQIDSLYTVNAQLKTENTKIKSEIVVEKSKSQELTKEKEKLTEQVNTASLLKAYNVNAKGIRLKSGGKKEELEEKSKKVDKIKISFTLSENTLAAKGNKTVYVRIAQPDGKILYTGEDDASSFKANGEVLQFSVKQDVNYEGSAKEVAAAWQKTTDFIPGRYSITVYIDGYQIGSTNLELK